jgi:hypothetical protein
MKRLRRSRAKTKVPEPLHPAELVESTKKAWPLGQALLIAGAKTHKDTDNFFAHGT